eukprot:1336499-Prymnesium_polylepis.1
MLIAHWLFLGSSGMTFLGYGIVELEDVENEHELVPTREECSRDRKLSAKPGTVKNLQMVWSGQQKTPASADIGVTGPSVTGPAGYATEQQVNGSPCSVSCRITRSSPEGALILLTSQSVRKSQSSYRSPSGARFTAPRLAWATR